jgi:bifunctional non-homologous end joining protein LigD
VFDLLRLDGNVSIDCRSKSARRACARWSSQPRRREGLPAEGEGAIRYAEHIVGDGEKLFEHADEIGLEGIISKRRDLPYEPGRSDSWRKSKVIQRGVFVIGGMTDPEGTRRGHRCAAGWLLRPSTGSGRAERESKGEGRASSLRDVSAPVFTRVCDRAPRAPRCPRTEAVSVRSADCEGARTPGALGETGARMRGHLHRVDERQAARAPVFVKIRRT